MADLEHLWPYPQEVRVDGAFPRPERVRLAGAAAPPRLVEDLQKIGGLTLAGAGAAYPLDLALEPAAQRAQGYRLSLAPAGGTLAAADPPGLAYGLHTLVQLLALHRRGRTWPHLTLADWPTYRKRCFMVDLGRSVFSLPLLQRIVRILERLKMNQLHLHLLDDELCGLKFEGLPFGHENPGALTLADLAALVRYAAEYHVELVPEIETWGHMGSLVYHRPELRGGEGMYAGSSFLLGPAAFALVERLVEQVAAVMPTGAVIHLGLDEAKWFAAPDLPAGFGPADLVWTYHALLMRIAARQGKRFTLRLWADHGGRPVPPELQPDIIIEPWQYWIKNRDKIDRAITQYGGAGKMRFMMGAGQSGGQPRGAFRATRHWARQGAACPNVEGLNVTFWCDNALPERLYSLLAGAYYAWHPLAATSFAALEDEEWFDFRAGQAMLRWQATFPEARPEALLAERGPLVDQGFYLWGENHGRPVAPTAPAAHTRGGHDYINEGADA